MCCSSSGVRGHSAVLWRLLPLYSFSCRRKIGGGRGGGRAGFEVCQNQHLQVLGDDGGECHWVVVIETHWGGVFCY